MEKKMDTLRSRTAVITGATGCIGSGAVHMLTENGMNVAMVTHNMADAETLIARVKHHPGQCVAFSNENGDAAVYGEIYEKFGSIDVIIPNHGAEFCNQDLKTITAAELDHKLHHQITGSFMMVQQALPYLEKSVAGRIILMASVGAESGLQEEGLLDCTARGGIISMTRYLAQNLAEKGITVNCIARGGVENEHFASITGNRIPLGRNGTAADFGAAVCYLASEEAGFMTGQILRLNGGMYMG